MNSAHSRNDRFRERIRREQKKQIIAEGRQELLRRDAVTTDFIHFKNTKGCHIPESCTLNFSLIPLSEVTDFVRQLRCQGANFSPDQIQSSTHWPLSCLNPNNLDFMTHLIKRQENVEFQDLLIHFFKETIKHVEQHYYSTAITALSFNDCQGKTGPHLSTGYFPSRLEDFRTVFKKQLSLSLLCSILRWWAVALNKLTCIELEHVQKIGAILTFWMDATSIRQKEDSWQLMRSLFELRRQIQAVRDPQSERRMGQEDCNAWWRLNWTVKLKLDMFECLKKMDHPQLGQIIVEQYLTYTEDSTQSIDMVNLNSYLIKQYILRLLQNKTNSQRRSTALLMVFSMLNREVFFKVEQKGKDDLIDNIIQSIFLNCLFDQSQQANAAIVIEYILEESNLNHKEILLDLPYEQLCSQIGIGNQREVYQMLLNSIYMTDSHPEIVHRVIRKCGLLEQIFRWTEQKESDYLIQQWIQLLRSQLPFYAQQYPLEVGKSLERVRQLDSKDTFTKFVAEASAIMHKDEPYV